MYIVDHEATVYLIVLKGSQTFLLNFYLKEALFYFFQKNRGF